MPIGQIRDHIFALMPLAALSQRRRAEYLTHRGVQAFRAVGDDEQAEVDAQTTLHELAEKRRTDFPILGCGLHESEEQLFSGEGDPDGRDHLIFRERFAV